MFLCKLPFISFSASYSKLKDLTVDKEADNTYIADVVSKIPAILPYIELKKY